MARSPGSGLRRGVAPRFLGARPVDAPLVAHPTQTAVITDIQEPETPDETPAVPATVHYTDKFAPRATSSAISLRPTTVDDVDRLWDWVRSDREGTTAFLGHSHPNSQSFFHQIGQIAAKELDRVAWMRSIMQHDELIGFVILDPITRTASPVGTCHVYISTVHRGSFPAMLPSILADGDRQLPNMTYFVATQDEAIAEILKGAGFAAQIVLTRPSAFGESHGSEGR